MVWLGKDAASLRPAAVAVDGQIPQRFSCHPGVPELRRGTVAGLVDDPWSAQGKRIADRGRAGQMGFRVVLSFRVCR